MHYKLNFCRLRIESKTNFVFTVCETVFHQNPCYFVSLSKQSFIFSACEDYDSITQVLQLARKELAETLSAFEYMSK